MAAKFARRRPRRSFTLVEMLVVVVIVGILAGLITAAAVVAQRTARNAVIVSEIGAMDLAAKAFKEKWGDYPPDGSDAAATKSFCAKAFQQNPGFAPPQLDPSTALVYWLGGSQSWIGTFFEFDPNRVQSGKYVPPNNNPQSEPYVYFRAKYDGTYSGAYGNCKPMMVNQKKAWANPKHFQIRSPGLDGKHGSGIDFPDGSDYPVDGSQLDDQSNFCSRGKFADEMP